MLRSILRRRVALFAALALLAAGPAYAFVNFLPGFVWPAAVPVTPAAGYLMPVTISPGLHGDTLVGIETGRDDRSPFVAITVLFSGNPANPNPIIGQIGPYIPNFPNFPAQPPYPGPPPLRFYLRFVYRPINDPANPGWAPLPGAAGQSDAAWQTCLQLATELSAWAASPLFQKQIYLEFDPTQSVTTLEFYKIHIIR